MASIPQIELNNGTKTPIVGFGTYKVGLNAEGVIDGEQARKVFADAIEVGYRVFDCAKFYGNEQYLGAALKESGLPREDFYLISKVWTDAIYAGEQAIRDQFEAQLSSLGVDYLDLYLIHWPVPIKHIEAYKTLEKLITEKKLRAAGLSNYTIEDYEELMQAGITVAPVVNQLEVNPFLYREKTLRYFQDKNIVIQAYRALRQATVLETELLAEIAKSHTKTPAQVLGRWCIQKNCVFIPKTSNKERMKENLDVFDFELTEDEVKRLDALTTDENKQAMLALYRKGLVRDTPLSDDAVRSKVTLD